LIAEPAPRSPFPSPEEYRQYEYPTLAVHRPRRARPPYWQRVLLGIRGLWERTTAKTLGILAGVVGVAGLLLVLSAVIGATQAVPPVRVIASVSNHLFGANTLHPVGPAVGGVDAATVSNGAPASIGSATAPPVAPNGHSPTPARAVSTPASTAARTSSPPSTLVTPVAPVAPVAPFVCYPTASNGACPQAGATCAKAQSGFYGSTATGESVRCVAIDGKYKWEPAN
jgi:hypothetical protein